MIFNSDPPRATRPPGICTCGVLPPPGTAALVKSRPWNALGALDFINRVDLVLPSECAALFQRELARIQSAQQQQQEQTQKHPQLRRMPSFSRVVLSLGDLLESPFFEHYVKPGHVLMVSKGRQTEDNTFTLRSGTLTMYLDRETYQRAGLPGRPHGVKRHSDSPRWVVTLDLRDPAMRPGKKGFERLLRACRNVLNQPTTWLFHHPVTTPPDQDQDQNQDPLAKHSPVRIEAAPLLSHSTRVSIPPLRPSPATLAGQDRFALDEFGAETYEWLSLVRLESPRILADDSVDQYISTYVVPTGDSVAVIEGEGAEDSMDADVDADVVGPVTGSVCKITWQGLLSSDFVRGVLVVALEMLEAAPPAGWFSLSATSFARDPAEDADEVLLLRMPGGSEYVLWEMMAR